MLNAELRKGLEGAANNAAIEIIHTIRENYGGVIAVLAEQHLAKMAAIIYAHTEKALHEAHKTGLAASD